MQKRLEQISDEQTKVLTKMPNYRIGALESYYQESKCR